MAKTSILMKMGLDSSKVKAGLDKAKAGVSSFATTAKDKLGGVAKLATGALVGGFLAAAKSAISYGKEMTNLSNIANTSFEDFQALAHGAKTVGVESDKLADIFKDTGDKIGDFLQTGGGPMVDFFENIAPAVGVTADEFKNLSGKDAMQLYFDSLQKANLSQEEMTFYMEAIASDASALIPLLKNGGKAWDDYADSAREAGLVMDKETRESLRLAQLEIDKLSTQVTIGSGNVIMGFKLMGASFSALHEKSIELYGGLGDLITGFASFDGGAVSTAMNDIKNSIVTTWGDIKKSINEDMGDIIGIPKAKTEIIDFGHEGVDALKGFYKEGSTGAKIQTEADRKLATEKLKQLDEIRKYEKANASIRDKIIAEQLKQSSMVQTAEQNHADAIEKRKTLEKQYGELAAIKNQSVIDALGLEPVLLAKKLELEKSITAETKTQLTLEKEHQELMQWRVDSAKKNVQLQIEEAKAAGEFVKARKLNEQLLLEEQIQAIIESTGVGREKALKLAKEQNEQTALRKQDEDELALAIAQGDTAQINRLDQKIQRREAIKALTKDGLVNDEEAGRIVDAQIDKAQERIDLEKQIVVARANGNDLLADALQDRIDKQDQAQELMTKFNLGLEEAIQLANKLGAIKAGPDLDGSGIVTRREQKEFDRQQKAKQKVIDKARREEEAEERRRGGNIKNVSEEKRNTGSIADRMAAAQEDRRRKAVDRAINRERDPAKRKALIDAEDERRKKQAKPGGPPPNGGDPKDPNGPGGDGKDPKDPNGPGGDGKDPKQPKDPAKEANDKLDKQIGLLEDIKAALKC